MMFKRNKNIYIITRRSSRSEDKKRHLILPLAIIFFSTQISIGSICKSTPLPFDYGPSLAKKGLRKIYTLDFSRRELWFQTYSNVYLLIFWWYKYIQGTWELINLKSGYAFHQQMGLQFNFTRGKKIWCYLNYQIT